jgi:hypothetical protein
VKRSKTCLGRVLSGLNEEMKLVWNPHLRHLPPRFEPKVRPLSERLLSRKFADQKA